MKIVIIGLLVLLGFRGSSVGLVKDNETNGGVSGVTPVLLGSIFFSDTNNGEKFNLPINEAQFIVAQNAEENQAGSLKDIYYSFILKSTSNTVYSFASSIITQIILNEDSSQDVYLKHKKYILVYHNLKNTFVKKGDKVLKGKLIGMKQNEEIFFSFFYKDKLIHQPRKYFVK